jgi:hypothetical protein
MARLILEEGGKRVAFRFDHGKLTIGSGEECTLTLKSPDVAEIHCDLEFGGERVVLRARAGVQPPVVNGSSAPGETALGASAVIEIGSAKIHLDLDESAAPAVAPKAAPPASSKAPSAGVKSRADKLASAKPAPRSGAPRVQRAKRSVSKGTPVWVFGLVGAGLMGLAALLLPRMFSDEGTGYDPTERIRVASIAFNEANYGGATQSLNLIDEETLTRMSPELRAKYDELRKRLVEKSKEGERLMAHDKGTQWKSTQLDRFRTDRLHGAKPPRERVRVYLKRVREFKERWPTHPEMDEVLRYETLFKEICDLSSPATFTDIAYEVKTMTWAFPRDYRGAFALIEKHLIANPGDAAHCNELMATMRAEQEEFFIDRKQQVKYEWQKNQKGQAVEILVQLIITLEDQMMIQEAADQLVDLPGIDDWFKGYKEDRPEQFSTLRQHPTVSAKVSSLGL